MADADKRLPPTERKLRKAREDGQVARSRDLGHFAVVAGCGALLVMLAQPLGGWLLELVKQALRFDRRVLTEPGAMATHLQPLALKLLWVVLPLGAVSALVAIASAVLVGGWNWTTKPLMPNFGKLNPLSGIKRLFSSHHLIDTGKAVLMTLVLGTIGGLYLKSHLPEFSDALSLPLPAAFAQVLGSMQTGVGLLLIALALFALIDVPLQRHQHMSRLKMSHQEVKQEMKEQEGNVEVKQKMRARMREMAKRRMLAAMPQADLVVMNPTHYAVALKYDEATMAAPRVIAKGVDLLALRIRDLAKESKVPVLEAPPLARALYAHAEVDREIPAALFGAVAQVLAYVYQLRAAMKGQAPLPKEVPSPVVPNELDPHLTPQKPSREADELDED